MKNRILLIVSLFISTLAFGQQNCGFTFTNNGVLNAYSFLPADILPHPYYYTWDFGDGSESHNVDPTHTYNSTGFYTVCLTIFDSLNMVTTCQWCDTFTISPPAGGGTCTWTVTGTGDTRTFHAQGTNSASTIHWDFGNGDTGTGSAYTYTYPAPGFYLVCMTESDSSGNVICSLCDHVTIAGTNNNCSFSYSADTTGFVQFFANVPVGSSVTWHFGDNSSGTGIDPHHTYDFPGTYLVCITSVFNNIPCTFCDSIVVASTTGGGSCSFTYSAGIINPNSVEFHATGMATSGNIFAWNFGDGATGHGSVESHLYALPGTYEVCLTVTDSLTGTILCSSCINIIVNGNSQGCQANYITTSLGLTAYFIDLSNLNSATYYWSFGDGTYSDAHFPHHTYAVAGTYNTCLSVAANGCTSTTCLLTTVDSTINTNPNCNASFAIVQIAPFEFSVVNLSSGVNINFDWDFGDGAHSDAAYPSHHYNSIGTYVLCLTVSDFLGCSSTYCDTLSVDSLGNIVYRGMSGFDINIVSPQTLTGVQEVPAASIFGVYPNPVSSTLTISLNEMKSDVTFRVFALDGREVTSGIFTKKDNALDVSGWNSGAYILEVRNAEGFKSHQKIIKE